MFMSTWLGTFLSVGSWSIFRLLLSEHGIQAGCELRYLMVVWSNHPGFLPNKDIPVQWETPTHLDISLELVLPGQTPVGPLWWLGNKSGPLSVPLWFHGYSSNQNKKQITTQTNEELSLWSGDILWQIEAGRLVWREWNGWRQARVFFSLMEISLPKKKPQPWWLQGGSSGDGHCETNQCLWERRLWRKSSSTIVLSVSVQTRIQWEQSGG